MAPRFSFGGLPPNTTIYHETEHGTIIGTPIFVEAQLNSFLPNGEPSFKEPPNNSCTMCESTASDHCRRCGVSYCCRKCQATDWPQHKLLCKASKEMDPRPSPKHYRAVLFPADQNKPKWIWLEYEDNPYSHGSEIPKFEQWLCGARGLRTINKNQVLDRMLKKQITVSYREYFLLDGSENTNSVVASTKGMSSHPWRGPVVVSGQLNRRDEEDGPGCDLDMSDFRTIVDFLSNFTQNTSFSDVHSNVATSWALPYCNLRKSPTGRCEGVRLNCEADVPILGSNNFQPVLVPNMHALFVKMETLSHITKLLKLPIHVWRNTRNGPFDPRPDAAEMRLRGNDNAASLMFKIVKHTSSDKADDASPGITIDAFDKRWIGDVGTVILARADHKPLLPQHAKALVSFCRYKISPLIARYKYDLKVGDTVDPYFRNEIKAGFLPKERPIAQEIVDEITKDKFMEFFEGYRQQKMVTEKEWVGVGSPYDV